MVHGSAWTQDHQGKEESIGLEFSQTVGLGFLLVIVDQWMVNGGSRNGKTEYLNKLSTQQKRTTKILLSCLVFITTLYLFDIIISLKHPISALAVYKVSLTKSCLSCRGHVRSQRRRGLFHPLQASSQICWPSLWSRVSRMPSHQEILTSMD